jgi:hypothetical protein
VDVKGLKKEIRKLIKECSEYYDTKVYFAWSKSKKKYISKRWKD